MPHYKLTYFNVRALGEHIRFLFVAAGVDFEEVTIPAEKWAEYKPKIKFGQVPVLEVDGKELSQSMAIARFLARQFDDFQCEDSFTEAKADEIVDFIIELRLLFRPWFLSKDEAEKSELKDVLIKETFPKYLAILESLASTLEGNFLGGEKPCWQDFVLANWLDIFEDTILGAKFLSKYSRLMGIKESVFAIPSIAQYLKTRVKSIV